jgi:hypothetical protein
MPSRPRDIDALLSRARKDLEVVERDYRDSLHRKVVSADLRIDIKNLCENLRSALDYLAQDIRERHCSAAKKARFYFPILPDRKQFEARMEEWFPGLGKVAPALWTLLESLQPYQQGYEWLNHFNRVNTENKHGQLVEQTRVETPRVTVTTPGGGQVSWDPRAVRFGNGVFVGGVPVDPHTQLPVPHPSIQVEKVVWVDFVFAGLGVSALALLQTALDGVTKITADVRKHLT